MKNDWSWFTGTLFLRNTYGSRGAWFRIKGYGLHVCTRKREDALFSERYGMTKALYLFGLRWQTLKP